MAAGGEKSLFFECVAAGKWALCLRMPHTHVYGAPLIGLGELLKRERGAGEMAEQLRALGLSFRAWLKQPPTTT